MSKVFFFFFSNYEYARLICIYIGLLESNKLHI
jgi:hypothetical protein